MVWFGSDLTDHLVQIPLPWPGIPLDANEQGQSLRNVNIFNKVSSHLEFKARLVKTLRECGLHCREN